MAAIASDEVLQQKIQERLRQVEREGFTGVCGFRTVSCAGGKAVVELDVGEAMLNPNRSLHGGAIATLIDHAGTLAVLTADREGRPGVSTDLSVSFLAPAPAGSTVVAEATALKVGRTLAFVTVDVRRRDDRVLVAQGRMSKYQPGT